MESARVEAQRPELTARQRARMADLSLLLDVIVNTSAAAAKRVCGLPVSQAFAAYEPPAQ